MVDVLRHTEDVGVEFLGSCHVSQPEVRIVGNLARHADGTFACGLLAFLVHNGEEELVAVLDIGEGHLVGILIRLGAIATDGNRLIVRLDARNLHRHVVEGLVVGHRNVQAVGGTSLHDECHFAARCCRESRVLEVTVHGNQHGARLLLVHDIGHSNHNVEVVAGLLCRDRERVVQVVGLERFAIDIDDIDGLVEVEFRAVQIDGRDTIIVCQVSADGECAACSRLDVRRGEVHRWR